MRYYVREAKWITLGAQAKKPGTKGANGKKHGGVAVLIGDDGVILKGPAHMKGKKPDELGGRQKTLGEKPGEKQEPRKYQNLAFGPDGEIAEPDAPKSPPPGAGYSDLRAAAKVEPVAAPPAPTAAKPAKTKAAKSQKPPENYDDKQDKKHARNLARLEKSRKELADIGDAARTLLAKAPPEMHAKIQDMIDRADAERNNLAAALKPTEFPDMGEPPPMATDYTPGADYSDSYDDLRKAAAQPAPEPTPAPAPAPAKPVKVPKVAKPEPVAAPTPEPKPEKGETVRAKIARIKAEKEKRYNDTLKKRGKKEADKQKADDKRQAKAEKDALNPAQAEARKKKQVERISKINAARPESLISLVRKEGGISGGDYDYATDIKEFGLKSALNKRGLKLDDMARALQNAGHLVVPEGKKAEDVLLAGLQARANSALHNHTGRYDSEYDDFINSREDADNAPGADSDRTASVISRGEEAGENQGDDDGLAQILGFEPSRSDADEPEPSDYGHPDDYEPSDYEPEEGDLGDGGEITGADTSFDFGAPEPPPAPAPAPSPASPPVDMFGNATTTAKKQPDMMTDMFGARIQAEAPKVTAAPTVADDAAKSLDWLDKNDPKKDGSAEMFGSLFSPGASGASAKTQPEAPGEGFADLRAAATQIKEPQRGWTSERQDFHRTGIGGVNTHAGKTPDGAAEFDELKNKLGSDSGEIASVNLGELYKKHLDAAMQQGGVGKEAFDSAMGEGPTGKNYSRLTALNGEAARRTRAELKEKTGPYIAHNTDGAIAAGYHANPADMVPGATDTDYRRSSAAIITGPETQAKNYKAIYGKPAKAGPALAEPLFGNQPAPAPTPATAPEPGTGYDDLRAAAAKEPEAPPAVGKPAHEMTKSEFLAQAPTDKAKQYMDTSSMHRNKVQAALDGGQNVPSEVLADYPGIKKTEPQPQQGPTAREIKAKLQAETDARQAQGEQDEANVRARNNQDYQKSRQAAIDAGQDVEDGDEKQIRRTIRQNEKDKASALGTIARNGPDTDAQDFADSMDRENNRLKAKLPKVAKPEAPPTVKPSTPAPGEGFADLRAAAAKEPEAPTAARAITFAQHRKENGISDFTADQGILSPSGKVSARARKAALDREDAKRAAYAEAEKDYQAKVDSGEISDPSGKYTKSKPAPAPEPFKKMTNKQGLANYNAQIGAAQKEIPKSPKKPKEPGLMASIMAQNKAGGATIATPPPTQKTKGLTDDPEKFQQGDRFKGENGEEFQVFASRQGALTAHPVVDGKPQINKSTEKKFAITDAAAAANPTHRRDFVPGFDQSQPGRDSEEIAQDRARLAKTPPPSPGEGFADLRAAAKEPEATPPESTPPAPEAPATPEAPTSLKVTKGIGYHRQGKTAAPAYLAKISGTHNGKTFNREFQDGDEDTEAKQAAYRKKKGTYSETHDINDGELYEHSQDGDRKLFAVLPSADGKKRREKVSYEMPEISEASRIMGKTKGGASAGTGRGEDIDIPEILAHQHKMALKAGTYKGLTLPDVARDLMASRGGQGEPEPTATPAPAPTPEPGAGYAELRAAAASEPEKTPEPTPPAPPKMSPGEKKRQQAEEFEAEKRVLAVLKNNSATHAELRKYTASSKSFDPENPLENPAHAAVDRLLKTGRLVSSGGESPTFSIKPSTPTPATPPPPQKPIDLPPKTPDTTSPGATTAPEPEKSKVEHFSVTASGRGFSQAIALLKKRGGKFNPATKTWAVPTGKVTADDASSFGLQQKAFPQAVRSKRDEDNFGNEDDPERFRVYR